LQKKNVPLPQLVLSRSPKHPHRHQFLLLQVAAFFRFSRSSAIFNPALVLVLERARLQAVLTALLILLTLTNHLNLSGCACLSSAPAAILCLPSMPSRSNKRLL
jgi:hypothetical protein